MLQSQLGQLAHPADILLVGHVTRDLASAADSAEGRDQSRITALSELLGRAG